MRERKNKTFRNTIIKLSIPLLGLLYVAESSSGASGKSYLSELKRDREEKR